MFVVIITSTTGIASQVKRNLESGPILHVVVLERSFVLERSGGPPDQLQLQALLDQAVDIVGHLVLDLDRIGGLDLQGDGLACKVLDKNMHLVLCRICLR